MIKLVCWNIAKDHDPWQCLVKNRRKADIALLQEATRPPPEVEDFLNEKDPKNVDACQFKEVNAQQSQCTIVKLTDKVDVKRLKPIPLTCARDGDFKTTHPGCLAAAIITPCDPCDGDSASFPTCPCSSANSGDTASSPQAISPSTMATVKTRAVIGRDVMTPCSSA